MKRSPILCSEIEKCNIGQNDAVISFRNTSWIKTRTSSENSRSARANIIIVDEFRMVDESVLNTVLRISTEKGFPHENIEVIPGISSLQLAAARNHIQWDSANVMTFHGRENIEDILEVINNGKVTIALPSRKVKDMAQFLLDNGVSENRPVTVCERLSYPDEKIVSTSLKNIAQSEFTYMCIMVIESEK